MIVCLELSTILGLLLSTVLAKGQQPSLRPQMMKETNSWLGCIVRRFLKQSTWIGVVIPKRWGKARRVSCACRFSCSSKGEMGLATQRHLLLLWILALVYSAPTCNHMHIKASYSSNFLAARIHLFCAVGHSPPVCVLLWQLGQMWA